VIQRSVNQKDLLRGGRKGRTTLFFMEVSNLQNGGKKLGPEYNQKLHTDVTLATNLHFRREIAIGFKKSGKASKIIKPLTLKECRLFWDQSLQLLHL